MDTFSRKHRLRQLQLQKQHHQHQQLLDYPHYDKENSQQYQSAANGPAMAAGGATLTRKCIRQYTSNHIEDNEFKVVRVIGLQESISCETSRFPRIASNFHTPLKSSKPTSNISLVRCHQTTGDAANHLLSQYNQSDSSGFSSSLYSTQVEIKHQSPTNCASQSKLIDELDRFIMQAEGDASPGDSYISCIDQRQQDSTLVRSNERVNSSLCGDEFSSFIAVAGGEKPAKYGADSTQRKELKVDKCDNHYSTISESEFSCDSGDEAKWCMQNSHSTLGTLLELHVAKVHTLLRLASGDRNVSMVEAFGSTDIPVSEEFAIPCQFKAAKPKPTEKRIIHDLEIVDLEDGEEFLEKSFRYRLEGTEVPFICPLELQLDWSESCIERGKRARLSQDLHSLKRSILERLLERQEEAPNECLVNKVSEHVSEFIENYVEFHNNLETYTTFSSDWHDNWLFASRGSAADRLNCDWSEEEEDESRIASKRARLSATTNQSQCDLLKYSTLILNSNRGRGRASLRYLSEQLLAVSSSVTEYLSKVDQFYQEQEEQVTELRHSKTNSLGLPDVCQLLLEEDCCGAETSRRPVAAKLQVSYESSILHLSQSAAQLSFLAYGYFIKTPLLISPNTSLMKLAQLKQHTLERLERLIRDAPSQLASTPANHQVRFSISVTNVELVNRLQVVQFCAQVVGYLPISVRWFRGSQEISNHRKSGQQVAGEWPVWYQANYDYQYKTEWSSWYRFRRNRDRILFEIRCPNKEQDYDVRYKCVIENYCSQAECNFYLKLRPPRDAAPSRSLVDLNNNKQPAEALGEVELAKRASANKARAVLRTWSQRTLKHQARVLDELPTVELEKNLQFGQLRSTTEPTPNDDKFGKDFPYHPENLLKRLQENMFSLSANRKSQHRSGQQLGNYCELVEQQIHFEPLEEPRAANVEELEKYSTPQVGLNYCNSSQNALPTSRGRDPPKPLDRLSKITAHVDQPLDNNHNSCMANRETKKLNSNTNPIDCKPITFDDHNSEDSRISSFPNSSGQTRLCRDQTSEHDSNGTYKLKTCVKSLISKFNMA